MTAIPFLSSVPVSLIAVIIGVAIFMLMCLRGSGTIPAAIVASLLVALCTQVGFVQSMFTTFLEGAAGFLQMMMLVFCVGGIFGGLLNATGCSDRIGIALAKTLGEKNIFIFIYVMAIVLQMAGVQPVVVISFLSFGMLRQLNLPRYIAMVACMGTSFVVLFNPTSTNVVVSNILGTTIYSQPLYAIILAAVQVVLIHLYVLHLIKDARKKGIGYDPMDNEDALKARDESELPNLGVAFTPVIFVIVWCLVTINVFGFASATAAVTGMLIASLFIFVVLGKNIKGRRFEVLEGSARPILFALMSSCAAVGFASVVQETAVFQALINNISNVGINGYIIAIVGTMIFCAICADGNAGAAAFLGVMKEPLMNTGLSVGVMHRLVAWSAATFDSMPHCGSVILFLSMFGYNHKQGYKYIVMSNIVITTCTTMIGLVIALIFFR